MSASPIDPPSHPGAPGLSPALAVLDGLVDRLVANQRAMAVLEAERAELFAAADAVIPVRGQELRGRRRRMAADLPAREVVAELAAGLRIGERAVQARLTDASLLVGSFPATLAALRDGHIDARHVAVILDAGAALGDPGLRGRFEEVVLPVARRETAARLRGHARELAARVDPDAVDRRAAAADERRTVRVYDLDDDLARLVLDQPATLIHAIYDRLTQQAKALRASGPDASGTAASAPAGTGDADTDAGAPAASAQAGAGVVETDAGVPVDPAADGAGRKDEDRVVVVTGPGRPREDAAAAAGPDPDPDGDGEDGEGEEGEVDGRTMDQLRADILTDMLLTGAPTGHGGGLDGIHAIVQVTVPLAALVPEDPGGGSSAGAAVLPSFGPIPIDTARTLAGHTPGWERVCPDPASGLPVAVDRYKPSARQRAYLTARDERCRFPGCRRPAHRCDVDHTEDAALGGATCICNLAHFCRRHHTIKHHTAWTVRQLGGGVLEWTSPTRRRYEDHPPTTVRFTPTEPPTAPPKASLEHDDPPPF